MVDTAGVDGERISHLVSGTNLHDLFHIIPWKFCMFPLTPLRDAFHKFFLFLFTAKRKDPVEHAMILQTLEAARNSDLILLMFDARVGMTSDFIDTARWLQKQANKDKEKTKGNPSNETNVVILANKLEGDKWSYGDSLVLDHLAEASRVGFGEAIPISAEHGEGLADLGILIDEATKMKHEFLVSQNLNESDMDSDISQSDHKEALKPLQLAILGRQNVGKSTLVNALLQQNRVITGPTPGLTRDAISIKWSWNSMPVQLVDTAGIRRISQRDYQNKIEDLSVQDAMRAMKTADVGVLVVDAGAKLLQRQELAIADAIVKEGRALVVAANKMDLIVDSQYTKEDYADGVRQQVEGRLPMLRRTPVVPMSSLTGDCVQNLMPVVFEARERWQKTISTGLLNRWLRDVIEQHPPPSSSGQSVKIKYIMQTKGRPPTFLLFCNVSDIQPTYLRYLMKNFQDTFQMFGMEVRMAIKKSAVENPYANKTNRTGGTGIGGKEARKARSIKHLKSHGTTMKKGKSRRGKVKR